MTITSVRLMFATDNRATPFALRGYFMNIFTSRTRHSRGVSPLRKNHMACMKKYKALISKYEPYILKYVPYISKQMACIFRHF